MNASTPIRNDDEEMPLDPAIERVRRRMMRLMAVSVAIMMVGLIAVVGAIVYKLSARSPGASTTPEQARAHLQLPAGARVVSAQLDGGDILFTVDPGEGHPQEYWIYRIGEGRVVAKVSID